MAIAPAVDKWLHDSGYEYHCFISWAHTINREMAVCARAVKTAVEQELALSIQAPRVFLDEAAIPAGAEWPVHLQQALCRSLALVAICAPIYYHPIHRWCGLEWSAMDALSGQRLPGHSFKAIVPLLFRRSDPLPQAVDGLQYIDLSRQQIRGRRFYATQEFRIAVNKIVERIEAVANAVFGLKVLPNCDGFIFPADSAFADYEAKPLPLPSRV